MFNAAAIVLVLSSTIVAVLALMAAFTGVSAAIGWNARSSSARQLRRERRVFLVESTIGVVLALQCVIFFLFLHTADRIHEQLAGAMCAAGSLHASRYGYPLLLLHVIGFVLAATWLLVNRATRCAVERRVVRIKQLSLLVIAIALAAQPALQVAYFAELRPEVLTSCCSTIFSSQADGVGSWLARMPASEVRIAFALMLLTTLAIGSAVLRRAASPLWFAGAALLMALVAMASLVAWIGPDVYGVASHHCPFCVLAPDHHYVGYPLYASLAAALVTAVSCGALRVVTGSPSGSPPERRLCRTSIVAWITFGALSWAPIIGSLLLPGGIEDVLP